MQKSYKLNDNPIFQKDTQNLKLKPHACIKKPIIQAYFYALRYAVQNTAHNSCHYLPSCPAAITTAQMLSIGEEEE